MDSFKTCSLKAARELFGGNTDINVSPEAIQGYFSWEFGLVAA